VYGSAGLFSAPCWWEKEEERKEFEEGEGEAEREQYANGKL